MSVDLQRAVMWMQVLSNLVLGPRWFRVRFTYRDRRGRVVFTIEKTVGVRAPDAIDDHRSIKQNTCHIYDLPTVPKAVLCNGTLEAEPTCYLGRWHKTHNAHVEVRHD